MVKVLTVDVDDTAQIDYPSADTDALLSWLQERVGGGFVEHIGGDGWGAWVNEDGRSRQLPRNHTATQLLRRLGVDVGTVVGAVVFVGPADHVDVPDLVVECAAELVVFDWQA